MKNIFAVILFLMCIIKVNADLVYNYTDWFDYYPSDVEEYRIQSEERYLWYKEFTDSDGNIKKETTNEYFKEKEGYTKVEGSSKMFYRVLHNCTIILGPNNNLIENSQWCIKNRGCYYVVLGSYEVQTHEENNNPDTSDNISVYLSFFIGSLSVILLNIKKII